MTENENGSNAKVEENKKEVDFKKSHEYRRFKKLLKKVVKSPPMPRRQRGTYNVQQETKLQQEDQWTARGD